MLPFENTSGCYEVAGKYPDKVKIGTQDIPDQLDPSDPQHSQHRQHSPDPKTPQNHQTQQSRQTYKSVYKISYGQGAIGNWNTVLWASEQNVRLN